MRKKQSTSEKSFIPAQRKGAKSDSSYSVDLKTTKAAKTFFKIAKKRLLDVSHWHTLCGLITATFALTDSSGKKIRRLARKGDYLRIDIPGPSSKSGKGYDWVCIRAIVYKEYPAKEFEQLAMKVRPAKNPTEGGGQTAHFFRAAATSTFIIIRKNQTVTAEIHGRNELPNVLQENKFDSIRNAFIAIGAMLGLAKWQWKKLVRGLLSEKK